MAGDPESLPPPLIGNLSAADLADLSWATAHPEFHGFGYWPIVDVTPAYDARLKYPTGVWISLTVDAASKSVHGVQELADVAHPTPRRISKADWRRRFTDDEQDAEALFEARVQGATETDLMANPLLLKGRKAYRLAGEVSEIELDHPDTLKFCQLLKFAGVIADDDRIAELLA